MYKEHIVPESKEIYSRTFGWMLILGSQSHKYDFFKYLSSILDPLDISSIKKEGYPLVTKGTVVGSIINTYFEPGFPILRLY